MANPTYRVRALWDEDSKSWWTDGEDIPGLCVQAASFDELFTTVLELAPEIMRDNGLAAVGDTIDIAVTAERRGTARLAA